MLLLSSGLLLTLASFVASLAELPSGSVNLTADRPDLSARFIVQFKDFNSLALNGQDEVSGFVTQLEDLGIEAKVHFKYASTIFHGVSISMSNKVNITEISILEDVENIHRVAFHKPEVVASNSTFDVSKLDLAALSHDSQTQVAANNTREPYNIHHMTGVDQLHAKGIKGAGVKIGFVESGVDYMHPALGGCFGPGCKVVGGYDFVGDSSTGDVPDNDPRDTCGKVGMMKAGLLFMDDEVSGVVGVAPEASIYAYRLNNCFTDVSDDLILAALQKAYGDGVDIIHVYFFENIAPGWAQNPLAVATANLVKEGVFVAISAGDVGNFGSFLPPDSTMGEGVAAVGSVDVDQIFASVAYASVSGRIGQRQIAYTEQFGQGIVNRFGDPLVQTLPVIEVTGSCTGEIPSSIPADLSQYVVLVKRECAFNIPDLALGPYKAGILFVYNSDPTQSQIFPARSAYKVLNIVNIDYDDGMFLSEALKTGANVTVAFALNPGVAVPNKNSPGMLSDNTQWGPDFELGFWPHFVAPGAEIFSTYAPNYGSYSIYGSGGMSSAYIAGVAALYYSQNGGRAELGKDGAKKLRDSIINTANPISFNDGSGPNFYAAAKRSVEETAPIQDREATPALDSDIKRATGQKERRDDCHHDNCLRAMIRASAEPFCSTYTTASMIMTLPSWASQCSGIASRISSGCSCLNSATTTSSSSIPTSSSSLITTSSSSFVTSSTSSSSIPTATSIGFKAPVAQQGGGLVNALNLLESTTTVTPNNLVLGDTADFKDIWSIEVQNPSSEKVTYHLSHDPSVTFYAVDNALPWKMKENPASGVISGGMAELSFKSPTFDVAAGGTKAFEVTISLPQGLSAEFLPVYSGYIKVTGSNGDTLTVPYQGVAANLLTDIPVWPESLMPMWPNLGSLEGYTVMPTDPYHNFTFSGWDYPYFSGFNLYGTAEQRIDVVKPEWTQKDWTYPPVAGKNNYIQSILTEDSTPFPLINKTRSFANTLWEYVWLGAYADIDADGNYGVVVGEYKTVMSVLRPKGDKSKQLDWQIVESAVFGVIDEVFD